MNIGELVASLGVDTGGLTSARRHMDTFANKAKNTFTSVTQTLKTTEVSLFSIKSAIVGLAGATGVGFLAKQFIDAGNTTEQLRIRLQHLLGSVEEGNKLFNAMADYAGKVPYEYKEIMSAATALAGVMKGGTEEVKQWMPMIGDLAAVTGLNVQETTSQVIRMYSAGAAAADMFRECGMLAMMGFQAGVHYTAQETREMMMKEWKKAGSQFYGATLDMGKSWKGMMSFFGDAWFQFRDSVMGAGVFDFMKEGANMALQEIQRLKDESKLDKWAKEMSDKIVASFEAIVIGAASVSDAFAGWKLNFLMIGKYWTKYVALPIWETLRKLRENTSDAQQFIKELTGVELPWMESSKQILEEQNLIVQQYKQNLEDIEKQLAGIAEGLNVKKAEELLLKLQDRLAELDTKTKETTDGQHKFNTSVKETGKSFANLDTIISNTTFATTFTDDLFSMNTLLQEQDHLLFQTAAGLTEFKVSSPFKEVAKDTEYATEKINIMEDGLAHFYEVAMSQTRSFGDFFTGVWDRIASYFQSVIAQMAAQATLGLGANTMNAIFPGAIEAGGASGIGMGDILSSGANLLTSPWTFGTSPVWEGLGQALPFSNEFLEGPWMGIGDILGTGGMIAGVASLVSSIFGGKKRPKDQRLTTGAYSAPLSDWMTQYGGGIGASHITGSETEFEAATRQLIQQVSSETFDNMAKVFTQILGEEAGKKYIQALQKATIDLPSEVMKTAYNEDMGALVTGIISAKVPQRIWAETMGVWQPFLEELGVGAEKAAQMVQDFSQRINSIDTSSFKTWQEASKYLTEQTTGIVGDWAKYVEKVAVYYKEINAVLSPKTETEQQMDKFAAWRDNMLALAEDIGANTQDVIDAYNKMVPDLNTKMEKARVSGGVDWTTEMLGMLTPAQKGNFSDYFQEIIGYKSSQYLQEQLGVAKETYGPSAYGITGGEKWIPGAGSQNAAPGTVRRTGMGWWEHKVTLSALEVMKQDFPAEYQRYQDAINLAETATGNYTDTLRKEFFPTITDAVEDTAITFSELTTELQGRYREIQSTINSLGGSIAERERNISSLSGLSAQLQFGELSPYGPYEKAQAGTDWYNTLKDLAMSDMGISDYMSFVPTYLSQMQDMWASSPTYVDKYQGVLADIKTIQAQQEEKKNEEFNELQTQTAILERIATALEQGGNETENWTIDKIIEEINQRQEYGVEI